MAASQTLRGYQRDAVEHLHRVSRGALFLDMGLGKTAITLTALRPEHLPVLVTAPKRVAEVVWPEEVRKWRPDLSLALAAGTPARRKEALTSGADIVVIGRDNLADAEKVAGRFRGFVIDELSGFKTRGSNRWRSAMRIVRALPPQAPVWGLTGTPSPNGLMDLWSQICLLDGGKRLGTTLTGFRERYFLPGRRINTGRVVSWLPREEAEGNIHHLLEDICLSMSSEGRVELPEVTYNYVKVPLPPAVRRLYRDMKADLVADLAVVGKDGLRSAPNAAAASNKLSQIVAGFIYPDMEGWLDHALIGDTPPEPASGEPEIVHHEKVRALLEILEGTGSPVLVFYRYRVEAKMIAAALTKAGIAYRTMDSPGVVPDWNAGKVPVLLAHPASAGHGLNLQYGGHTMVWTSCTWSLEEWQQGNKRLLRPGQEHPVIVHVLESPGTVDEAIRERLETKRSVQDALLDHLESPL